MWRANKDSKYYYLRTMKRKPTKVSSTYECGDIVDDTRYNSGNYFQTKQQAQAAIADYDKKQER
jgi:hypothetical protein